MKNAVVLAALVFGGEATDLSRVLAAFTILVAFCLASSAIYIINDVLDRDRDRIHPTKRTRPIASGSVSSRPALQVASMLAIVATGLAVWVGTAPAVWVGSYQLFMIAYCMWLKHVPVIDVLAIGGGFLIRVMGGASAVDVPVSPWLLWCTLLLALFLGFGKRRNEVLSLSASAVLHRPALRAYSIVILDILIYGTAAMSVVLYAVYASTSDTAPRGNAMELSVPFVAIAIGRYLYLIYQRSLGGSPESILLSDRPLLGSILLWGAVVLVVLGWT